MAKERRHRLYDKDFEALTAACVICGPVRLQIVGNAWMCENSYRQSKARSKAGRTRASWPTKQDECEACQFVPVDPCQLEQEVIGGEHRNGFNVWTLCRNCLHLYWYKPEIFLASIGGWQASPRVPRVVRAVR